MAKWLKDTERCFKQLLKVSSELVNILQKYLRSNNIWQAVQKETETHNRIFRRCVNVVL